MEMTLDTKARLLHARQTAAKLGLAYLTSGLYNFVISTAFVYVTEDRIAISGVTPAIQTIFFWPISSLSSARVIFGGNNATIWSYLIAANMLVFAAIVVSVIAQRAQTEFESEIEETDES